VALPQLQRQQRVSVNKRAREVATRRLGVHAAQHGRHALLQHDQLVAVV